MKKNHLFIVIALCLVAIGLHAKPAFAAQKLYIVDTSDNRIESFSATGTYGGQFGTSTFSNPYGIAIDLYGNIWATDDTLNELLKFSSSGTYIAAYGSSGSGNDQFNAPDGIAIDGGGNIWVADSGNNRIEEFFPSGSYESQASQGMNNPFDIAIDGSGNLWVSNQNGNNIEEFTSNGTYVSSFGSGGTGSGNFSGPQGLTFDASGHLWVVDGSNNRLEEFSGTSTYVAQVGCASGACTASASNGKFDDPLTLAFDASGNMWVSDELNYRFQELSPTGTYIGKFGSAGTGNNQFGEVGPTFLAFSSTTTATAPSISSVASAPGTTSAVITWTTNVGATSLVNFGTSVSYGSASVYNSSYVTSHSVTLTGLVSNTTYDYQVLSNDGNIATSSNYTFTTSAITSPNGLTYVADNYNDRIQIFTASGTYVGAFGSGASSSFNDPYGIAIDGSGNIWTTDNLNGDVEGFTSAGVYISSFGSGYLSNPTKLAIDASGNFWVEDDNNDAIYEFSSAGVHLKTISIANGGDGIAINSSGTILVAEDNDVVYEYNASGTNTGSFGSSGSGNSQFLDIDGLTVSGNKLFVDDTNNNRIDIWVASGTTYAYSGHFGSSAQLSDANNIAIDSSGHLWISDKANDDLIEYYASGTTYTYHATFGSYGTALGDFITPAGIGIDSSNNIYIADQGNNRVQKFTLPSTYSSFGAPPAGSVSDPRDVAIDASGNVWVTNVDQNEIQEFSPGGTYESGFTLNTSGENDPDGVAFDKSGNIWVVMSGDADQVTEFTASGTIEEQFGSYGSGPGDFVGEGGIAISASGTIWVGDGGNNRAQEFSATGTYLGQLGCAGTSACTGGSGNGAIAGDIPELAIDSSGNIWVDDNGNDRAEEFSATGTYERQIDITSYEPFPYPDIEGIAVDASGNVWMTDVYHGNNLVDEFTPSSTLLNQIGYVNTGNGSSTPGYFNNPLGITIGTGSVGVTNISSASTQHWAWNDKIGWMDFYDTQNIVVSASKLIGYASSSAGTISLDCGTSPSGSICGTSNYGISNDGSGNLAGWAWSDLYGWISFCGNGGGSGSTLSGSTWVCPSSPTYQVVINPSTGVFSGWAWNDNIGWISFNCSNTGTCGTSQYDVVTTWTVSGTNATGTLDSETFDTGVSSGAELNSVTWRGSAPASTTVGFQFSVSNSSSGPWSYTGPDGTAGTEYTGSSGSAISLTNYPSLKGRYFRYRVILSTNPSGTATPRVQGVSVDWSP